MSFTKTFKSCLGIVAAAAVLVAILGITLLLVVVSACKITVNVNNQKPTEYVNIHGGAISKCPVE